MFLFECPRIINHFTSSKIKWSFILEKAPWWGGFNERMIKSVKRCLRKTLGNARLTYEELHTELVEIEAILNSSPLTYSISIKVVHEQSGIVEYERERLLGTALKIH